MGVEHVLFALDQPHGDHLAHGEGGKVPVSLRPHRVAFVAEIFQPDPDAVFRIADHIGRPVVVDLKAAHLHVPVVDIDPVVRHDAAECRDPGLVPEFQFPDQHADGHVVPVGKAGSNFPAGIGHVVHPGDEIPDRHGGDHIIPGYGDLPAVLLIDEPGQRIALSPDDPGDPGVPEDLSAPVFHRLRCEVPQLPGAELRIGELLNERGLDLAVLFVEDFPEDIAEHRPDGQPFHALGAPLRRDLPGVTPPQVLGIVLKEHGIEFFSETVDIEILKGLFLPLEKDGLQVAEADHEGRPEAHVPDRFPFQGDGIIKETRVEEDPREAVPPEHDPVGLLRVGSAGNGRAHTVKHDVVVGERALRGEHLLPPGVDLRDLGEETVAAHVHPVSVMADCAGYAAENSALLEDDHVIRIRPLQQLIGRRQPCRACPDDQYGLFHVFP